MAGRLVIFLLWLVHSGLLVLVHSAASTPLYIKAGTVVNADRQFKAHVLIVDGKVSAVGPDVQAPPGAKLLDATGKLVMPGGIDPHTHLSMPFSGTLACDDFESGQSAALAGGTTMHIDFALPVAGDLEAGFKEWQGKAANSVMDYSFHMAVTTWNEKVAKDMEMLTAAGINSFKFFMAYKGVFQVSDEQMLAGFRKCKELGAIAQVHAENGDAVVESQQRTFDAGITGPEGHAISRPAILEGEATGRAIRLAAHVNTPLYVVHVMSKDALTEVVSARTAGYRVIGEAVASGIALTDIGLWDPDFDKAARFVMSPPIRGAGTATALKGAIAGGLLQVLATDHAVFNTTQKRRGRQDFRQIPNGVNGIEERLHVAWEELVNSGLISRSDFVRLVSTAAAQIFGIYPQKGHIAPGSDADIIIFDPNLEHVISPSSHHSRTDTNIYEGKVVRGKVSTTISQGRVVWENGRLHVQPGTGRFIPRPRFPKMFDGLEHMDAAWLQSNYPYGRTPVWRQGDISQAPRDEL